MEQHPLAGKTVTLKSKSTELNGQHYRVEDYWKNVSGRSWRDSFDVPACLQYSMRSMAQGLPQDDNALYGKIGILGFIVHASEIGEVVS